MSKLESLEAELARATEGLEAIEAKIQIECNAVFEASEFVKRAVASAENSNQYQLDSNGEVESWVRVNGLADFEKYKAQFETWLAEQHCMHVDWTNEALLMNQGESIIINEEDGGVYLGHKCIVRVSEYRTEDRDTDTEESKRNDLIEAYMQKEGFFPGVFRVTQYGDAFFVNTKKEVKS